MLSIDLSTIDKSLVNWQGVIERVIKGEPVNLNQSGVTIARLYPEPHQLPLQKRKIGFMEGEIQYPDDIHADDDEVLAMFEESIASQPL